MTSIVQPTYLAVQPSTGKKLKFRPFTVKEEKALLLALQEDNMETMGAAIKSLMLACVQDLDPDLVPYYDLEYLFLQIRSKSVGELIDLVGSCECSETAKTQFSVDIATTVVEPQPQSKTELRIVDTDYTVAVQHPHLDDFIKLYNDPGSATEVVSNCILSVFTPDEVMTWTKQEKLDFVESMSPKQQKDLAQFLKNMPMVKIPAVYKCSSCGKEHSTPLSGISNFFR
jgi:hypothetical protein